MAPRIDGRRVAFLATDGVEQAELDQPWQAVRDAGGYPELIGLAPGSIRAFRHVDKGDEKQIDTTVSRADPDEYDALALPGGVINGDFVRGNQEAVRFVHRFARSGKPIGVICHGGWVLIEADAVRGRTMTSWPTLRTDFRNAGAHWVDERVVVDHGLVSSRKPADLDAFCDKLVEEIAERVHGARRPA